MKLLFLLVNLLFFVHRTCHSTSNAGETKMLAKLEKLNKMIEEYKQSSTNTDDPLLATKIADLNNLSNNLKSQIRTKRKAKEVAKKTQEEEEIKRKEKLKQEAEAAKEAEKKIKEKLQREAEARKKAQESKPKSFTIESNVMHWIHDIMKQHVHPFLSTIPVPHFVRDMKVFLDDNIFFGIPAQHRRYAFWGSLLLLTFLSWITLIATVTNGRRKLQKKKTFDLMNDSSTTMTPAEIQRLQMEKQALESRLRMITAMRNSNNNNDNDVSSTMSSTEEQQKVLDEAARQVAQSKLVSTFYISL